jgi:hypothetical protein
MESRSRGVLDAPVKPGHDRKVGSAVFRPPITNARAFAIVGARHISQPGARRIVMAKGQMRSNKEKKKPKADKNLKKGGATPSPFSSGKMQMQPGQNLGKKT